MIQTRSTELEERHRRALELLLAEDPRGDAASGAVLEVALASLGSDEDGALARAEQVLGWCGRAAADRLCSELELDPSPSLAIVRAAGATGDQAAVGPLVRLLRHADPRQREASAEALGRIRDPGGVEQLLRGTRDPVLYVRVAALGALDAMGVAAVTVGLAALTRPYFGAQMNIGSDGRQLGGFRARLRGVRATAGQLYGRIATARSGSGHPARLSAPPAAHGPRELAPGSDSPSMPVTTQSRHDLRDQSLAEQARVRVSGMVDEELADSYNMAARLRAEADQQGKTARSELWLTLERATVHEVRSRQDFGAEDGERSLGRRALRRRRKRLLPLGEALDAASTAE